MIKSARKATNEEWDQFTAAAPSALYFQTREWFDIWSEYAGFKMIQPCSLLRAGDRSSCRSLV